MGYINKMLIQVDIIQNQYCTMKLPSSMPYKWSLPYFYAKAFSDENGSME